MATRRKVEHYSVGARVLRDSPGLRLDASYYNPGVALALERLHRSGMKLQPLGEVVEKVFIPPRFKRIYVDEEHGIPFLQGSHVVQFQPAGIRYLSVKAHHRLERWVIEKGWILVTCSGTVGRIAIAPQQWDGWAASQHILRIIPDDDGPCPAGYLSAYLRSSIGQAQLTAQIYGAVVDELTEDQAKGVLVPVPKTKKEKKTVEEIDALARESVVQWSEAIEAADGAVARAEAIAPDVEEDDSEYSAFEALARKIANVPKGELDEVAKTKKRRRQ